MARVIKPPASLDFDATKSSVFLAGSIEMGSAEIWQERVEQALERLDVVVLNPRRDEWDSSWVQRIESQPFRQQVEWELEAQESATLIAMYFDPATRSPITLLELGLAARSEKLLVCCPEGFWRLGNIEVVCARYDVPLFSHLDEMIDETKHRLQGEPSSRRI